MTFLRSVLFTSLLMTSKLPAHSLSNSLGNPDKGFFSEFIRRVLAWNESKHGKLRQLHGPQGKAYLDWASLNINEWDMPIGDRDALPTFSWEYDVVNNQFVGWRFFLSVGKENSTKQRELALALHKELPAQHFWGLEFSSYQNSIGVVEANTKTPEWILKRYLNGKLIAHVESRPVPIETNDAPLGDWLNRFPFSHSIFSLWSSKDFLTSQGPIFYRARISSINLMDLPSMARTLSRAVRKEFGLPLRILDYKGPNDVTLVYP
jgi:hypothetical protein